MLPMKYSFWPAVMGVLTSLFLIALVLTNSSTAWGKLKYSFAGILLGALVYYLGDRI